MSDKVKLIVSVLIGSLIALAIGFSFNALQRNQLSKEIEAVSQISFIERYRILNGDVWIQFDDEYSDWKMSVRSIGIYLSNLTNGPITIVVADGKQITLAPRIAGICMATFADRRETSTTCEDK